MDAAGTGPGGGERTGRTLATRTVRDAATAVARVAPIAQRVSPTMTRGWCRMSWTARRYGRTMVWLMLSPAVSAIGWARSTNEWVGGRPRRWRVARGSAVTSAVITPRSE
jgi:hypothetical protein